MSNIQEHIAYLSQNIGPRPAGTEEERQAALYLADAFQQEAGLEATVEDFSCGKGREVVRASTAGVAAVFALLTLFLPVMVVPSLLICAVAAVLFALESLGKMPDLPAGQSGASQNVVARYEPVAKAGKPARRRKVVVVARYDTGRACGFLKEPLVSLLPTAKWVELGGLALLPLVLLVRLLSSAEGGVLVFLNVLLVLAVLAALFSVAAFVAERVAPYTDGANCNASGVSVMMEVATRLGLGRAAAQASEDVAVIHGEEAARESGYVPAGADLVYETDAVSASGAALRSDSEESPAARLMAAKAAVAALSGRPVSDGINIDIADHLAQVKEPPLPVQTPEAMRKFREETMRAFAGPSSADHQEAFSGEEPLARDDEREVSQEFVHGIGGDASDDGDVAGAPRLDDRPSSPVHDVLPVASVPASEEVYVPSNEVPSWFTAAREKAEKSTRPAAPVRRSRYADALDAALREPSEHFSPSHDAVMSEPELRLQKIREDMVEAAASDLGNASPVFAAVQAEQDASFSSAAAGEPILPRDGGDAVDDKGVAFAPSDDGDGTSSASAAADSVSAHRALSAIPAAEGLSSDQVALGAPASLDEVSNSLQAAGQPPRQDGAANLMDLPSLEPLPRKKRALDLPGLTGSLPAVGGAPKQRAPLAEERPAAHERAQRLRASLPSVVSAPAVTNAAAPDISSSHAALRDMLPSLSGSMPAVSVASVGDGQVGVARENVSVAGSFASAGATGAFAPVGDELLEDVAPEDRYVEDADDSAYDEQFTETGAFAGPGYVEMPKSRAGRFFKKFRFGRDKSPDQETPQEWLNVEDDFEAREVGKARGGWESFRDGDYDAGYDAADDYDEFYDDEFSDDGRSSRGWNGGGFSRKTLGKLLDRSSREARRAEDRSRSEEPAAGETSAMPSLSVDGAVAYENDFFDAPRADDAGYADDVMHDAYASDVMFEAWDADGVLSSSETGGMDAVDAEAVQRIYGFRHADIDIEVMFVALGAEYAGNAGMKNFLRTHAAELKGAVFVELEGMGAGSLSLVDKEGTYRPVKASSRLKRPVRKAAASLNINMGSVSLRWVDGAATCALRQGHQAIHLVGEAGGKPAYYGEADDVAENVSEEAMLRNADFVMEFLKNI